MNVARYLPELALRRPDQPAVYSPVVSVFSRIRYRRFTYRELDTDSDRIARGLRQVGIDRGTRTVLMVPPGHDFFALTFALFKLGAVPVIVDPGLGVWPIRRCLAEAQPQAFIGVAKAHLARRLFGWGRASVRAAIAVGGFDGISLEKVRHLGSGGGPVLCEPNADEPAAILFTSGSTGPPKGVVYTHGHFDAQLKALRNLYSIEPGEVDLCTFPLFALFAPALGMTAVVPVMNPTRPASVNPENIRRPVVEFAVTNLFGSPALIDRVGRYAMTTGCQLPTLRRAISAGAPVPAAVVERFTKLLSPGVQLFTPYGMTEALPVASIGSDEILGETRALTDAGAGVCVGRPVPEIEAAVIGVTDDAIGEWSDALRSPPGEVGEITVRGRHVTREYLRRPDATARAKVGEWHRTGDLGRFDDLGRLWFHGRKAHRVWTGDGPLDSIPVEAVFNTHPAVFRSALVGVGSRPVLCVELEAGAKSGNQKLLIDELRAIAGRHPHARTIEAFLIHPKFPVDVRHNSKIFREKLAVWAKGRLR